MRVEQFSLLNFEQRRYAYNYLRELTRQILGFTKTKMHHIILSPAETGISLFNRIIKRTTQMICNRYDSKGSEGCTDLSLITVVCLCTTGRVSYNIWGQTHHRGLKIPFNQRDYIPIGPDDLDTFCCSYWS